MKITRYFQSCLLVEENGVRILFDPSGHEAVDSDKFGRLDAVVYTHEHGDHFDADLAAKLAGQGTAVYANASTAAQISTKPNVVSDGQEFAVGSVKIKAIELPHCLMWHGEPGPQNTGYLVNDRLFNPGDGVQPRGVTAELLALPITGPDISLKDAIDFAHQLESKTVIPVHYDYIGTKPEVFAHVAKGLEVKIIANGETLEI